MPLKNETGSVLTVGPDVDGNHFDVQPGDDYELPEPPRTVSDEEEEAQAEEEPPEDDKSDLGSTPEEVSPEPVDELPEPPADKEGTPE